MGAGIRRWVTQVSRREDCIFRHLLLTSKRAGGKVGSSVMQETSTASPRCFTVLGADSSAVIRSKRLRAGLGLVDVVGRLLVSKQVGLDEAERIESQADQGRCHGSRVSRTSGQGRQLLGLGRRVSVNCRGEERRNNADLNLVDPETRNRRRRITSDAVCRTQGREAR
jgi:hypothetical protein